MRKRLVSVVIPCLNCCETIGRCVPCLKDQHLPEGVELEIIAVDNGSTDGSLEALQRLPLRFVQEARRGPAAARNAGVRAARGEVIVFLDADTRPASRELIAEHLKTLSLADEIGISGGAISPDPEQKSWIAFAENATALFNWHDGLPARFLSFQPTGNLAFKREVYDRVGPLHEGLFWLEDFEWNMRVQKAGYKIFFNPKAGVYIWGRESLPAALKKFYTWGLNIWKIYVPGRPDQVWLCKNQRYLFCLNIPLRILNETYVTVKRWIRRCPVKTLLLIPLFLLFRSMWGLGILQGTRKGGSHNGNTARLSLFKKAE
jgi:glycosyltransferase involved in cell wall biosynthesis